MIGDIIVSPACGNSESLQVFNKKQSTISERIGYTQKLDTSIDRKLPDGRDSASIFNKVIGCGLSHNSSSNLYLRFWMDFVNNLVQTEAQYFVELVVPAINTLDEVGIFRNPATRIRKPTDGSHWSVLDHVFGEETAVGTSAIRSEQDYSYKTDFEVWKENQDFGSKNISMSQPPLDSNIWFKKNRETSSLDSIPIRTKTPKSSQ